MPCDSGMHVFRFKISPRTVIKKLWRNGVREHKQQVQAAAAIIRWHHERRRDKVMAGLLGDRPLRCLADLHGRQRRRSRNESPGTEYTAEDVSWNNNTLLIPSQV